MVVLFTRQSPFDCLVFLPQNGFLAPSQLELDWRVLARQDLERASGFSP